MSVVHCARDLGQECDGVARRQRTRSQPLRQRRPIDELHGEVWPAIVLADFMHRDDVRMREPGGGFGLGAEPPAICLSSQIAAQHHLERDDAIETDLPRAIHDTHAAASDLGLYFVVAERRQWRAARRCGTELLRTGDFAGDGVSQLRGRPELPQFLREIRLGAGR